MLTRSCFVVSSLPPPPSCPLDQERRRRRRRGALWLMCVCVLIPSIKMPAQPPPMAGLWFILREHFHPPLPLREAAAEAKAVVSIVSGGRASSLSSLSPLSFLSHSAVAAQEEGRKLMLPAAPLFLQPREGHPSPRVFVLCTHNTIYGRRRQ